MNELMDKIYKINYERQALPENDPRREILRQESKKITEKIRILEG